VEWEINRRRAPKAGKHTFLGDILHMYACVCFFLICHIVLRFSCIALLCVSVYVVRVHIRHNYYNENRMYMHES
jgi:hypothetical protein